MSMTYKEYIELAMTTNKQQNFLNQEIKNLSLNENMLHSILGLVTEENELLFAFENNDNVNIVEELGDIMWYVALWSKTTGFIPEIKEKYDPADGFFKVYELLDMAKRTLYYKAPFDMEQANRYVEHIFNTINDLCSKLKIDFENILDININKLKQRYPNGFDEEKAVKRNTKKEVKVMVETINKQGS